MPVNLPELRPYKSYALASVRDGVDEAVVLNTALDDIHAELDLDPQNGPRRLVTRRDPTLSGGLEVAFLYYAEDRPTSWSVDPTVVDRLNQLIIICRRNRLVAIHFSDPRARGAIVKRFDQESAVGLGALRAIPDALLNAAFVHGQTRTLWLAGTHRRTSIKADNKILTGIDLRDALDPIDDQTYRFTSARTLLEATSLTQPIGVTPRESRAWAGATRDWDDFRGITSALLAHLEGITEPDVAPLPVVAVASAAVTNVGGAFDVAVLPPELAIDDQDLAPEVREMMERWAYRGSFEITETEGPSFTAAVMIDGISIGTVEFTVDIDDPNHVTWAVEGQPSASAMTDLHREALTVCRKRSWVSIRYESGHTITGGAMFEVRHRDFPFTGFCWVDLTGHNVTREKPEPLGEIGNQDSLFCWTKNRWPNLAGDSDPGGWLACDDGSMEIADFIHLDDSTNPPTITLIHIKGAGSASPNRRISVSSYEVVTGQAVKNLRYVDRLNVEGGLVAGLDHQVGQMVWNNRTPTTREHMIAALQGAGANYRRRVVILQPHVTHASWSTARAHPGSGDAARLRQLDTLLLSAEASCRALGADLIVLSSL